MILWFYFLSFMLGSHTSALGGHSLWIAEDCPCPTIRGFLCKSAHCPWAFAHFHMYKIQVFVISPLSEEPPGALSGFARKTTLLHSACKLSPIGSDSVISSEVLHKSLGVQYMLVGNLCKFILQIILTNNAE